MWVKQSLTTCFKSQVFVLLRRLNIVPSYLPKSPSAALLSIALATAQSSALHRKICSAQSGAIFSRQSNSKIVTSICHFLFFQLRRQVHHTVPVQLADTIDIKKSFHCRCISFCEVFDTVILICKWHGSIAQK